nr:hypothetical protein [Tanacetum cinerariifolium]
VEQRCAKLDARLDALSIDFDEELYPHMLIAIAGRRWVIGYGLRLTMMKCAESLEIRQAFADDVSAGVAKGMSEGLKHGVEHGHAQLKVESIEAYDPEAEAKFVSALQSFKDLKYPMVDQLECLKDAPMDVIMAALYLESDTGEDDPQYIRDLRPSSSQLTIPVYPEKKKCRIVCRTHGVGSAHHARSDGVPVSVPTVVPQGLALLLVDAATQTGFEDSITASVPYVREKGVSPWLDLIIVRLLFALSTSPLDCGCLTDDVPANSAPEAGQVEEVAITDPSLVIESRKRCHDGADANTPPKMLRRDHADPRPTGSTLGGKNPLSFANPRSRHPADVTQSSQCTAMAGDPESENASFAFAVGSPESIYRPKWGVVNGIMLDTLEACQALWTMSLLRRRLRFEQEAKLLRKSVAQVARRDKRIQVQEHEIKNLEALLKAEADMKKAAEDRNARLSQELEDMRALFSDLQVSNNHLSRHVAALQEQVSREEKLKAAFEEFKRYEDSRVKQHCAKMDARLDALSIDFDEELYPHMLTAIACRRWMIGHELRLAVMKCGESLKLRQAFTDVVSAGIAKGMSDDLKYPLVDQLKGLKDAPMDVIMTALYLKSDTGDDALQWVRDLRPSSSQLTIPVYPEKKKKCRIVCRTHRVGSAHHARSDGVPVSVPTVIPQGLAILLADAATLTDTD